MKYYHDKGNRTVYAVEEPTVYVKDRHWHVSASVTITQADNYLVKHRWKHATSACPSDSYFQKNDTKENAIGYFMMNKISGFGDLISKEDYDKFQAEYEAEARANKPPEE